MSTYQEQENDLYGVTPNPTPPPNDDTSLRPEQSSKQSELSVEAALDNTLPRIHFSDLVQMVRMKYTENGIDSLGYAKAAAMVDRAIKPQELEARKNAFEIVERVFTGSEDFKINPGVDLHLTIGQIKQFRDGTQALIKNLYDQAKYMEEV